MPIDDRLLDAAGAVLEEHGPAAMTLERVCGAAGMSRMTLHRHGVGRDELAAALVERMLADERAELWIPLAEAGDAATRLRRVLERRCALAERHLAVIELMDARSRDAAFHGPDGMTRAEFVDPLRRLLEDGVVDGSLRSEDPVEDATLLYNLVGHTYRHLRTGHGWSAERARASVLRVALDGVRSR